MIGPIILAKVCAFGCACKQLFIQYVKLLLGNLLVIENLDHSLAVHPFFNKSGNIGQIQLLADKIFSTVSGHLAGYQNHDKNHQHCQNCQNRAENQHGNKRNYNCKC